HRLPRQRRSRTGDLRGPGGHGRTRGGHVRPGRAAAARLRALDRLRDRSGRPDRRRSQRGGRLPDGAEQRGRARLHGAAPPAGHGVHHYYFWVYALDTRVAGEPTLEEFLTSYGDHVIEQNRVVGTYSA